MADESPVILHSFFLNFLYVLIKKKAPNQVPFSLRNILS